MFSSCQEARAAVHLQLKALCTLQILCHGQCSRGWQNTTHLWIQAHLSMVLHVLESEGNSFSLVSCGLSWQSVKVDPVCDLDHRPLFSKRFSTGCTAAWQLGRLRHHFLSAPTEPFGPTSSLGLCPGWKCGKTQQKPDSRGCTQWTSAQQSNSCSLTAYRSQSPPDVHYAALIDNILGKVHLWRVYCKLHQPQMLQL